MTALTLWRHARLATMAGAELWGEIADGALLVEGDRLHWVGRDGAWPKDGRIDDEAGGSQGPSTASGPASARGSRSATSGPVTFQSLDADNNGKVSKTEADASPDVAKAFGNLDKNKDGSLDQAEFKNHKSK